MIGRDILFWNEVGLFCGIMTEDDMLPYLRIREPKGGLSPTDACRRVKDIDSLRSSTSNSMSRVLTCGQSSCATIRRDKVYGVLGLCRDKLKPNYSDEVADEEIFTAATMVILQEVPLELRFLSSVDHESPSSCAPSWVADWGTGRMTQPLGLDMFQGVYSAHKRTLLEIGINEIQKILYISGKVFDTVAECLDVCREPIFNPSVQELEEQSCPTYTTLAAIRSFALSHLPYPSTSTLFEATWMTLVAGSDNSMLRVAPAGYGGIFGLLFDKAAGVSPSFSDQPVPERRLNLKNLEARRPGQLYREIQIASARAMTNRRFASTSRGYLGALPRGTRPGDRIVVFKGGAVPFVVRRHGPTASQLIGECYVHGIMRGEVIDMENIPYETVTLV